MFFLVSVMRIQQTFRMTQIFLEFLSLFVDYLALLCGVQFLPFNIFIWYFVFDFYSLHFFLHCIKVNFTASLGTFDVAALVDGVRINGEGQMHMNISSSQLSALNRQLQFITYTNTIFHPNTVDVGKLFLDLALSFSSLKYITVYKQDIADKYLCIQNCVKLKHFHTKGQQWELEKCPVDSHISVFPIINSVL